MTALFCSVAGRRVHKATLRLVWAGVWSFDGDLDEAGADITGRVSVTFGGLTLSGTVDPRNSGAWAEGRHVRVYGGALGWGKELRPKPYHNDAGVRASEVLRGAALEAGETLSFDSALEAKIGGDFIRERGAASQVFADVVPAAVWWVDLEGVTQVAASRPSVELADGIDLELLDYDPSNRVAYLAGDPEAVQIGTVLRPARFGGRLAAPVVVRELVYTLSGQEIRITAHETSDEPGGRILGPLAKLMRRIRDERLPGLYRYRVVSTDGARVKLQAVEKGRWPDVLPSSLGAGIAGGWADLTPGAIVGVMFEDESRANPLIVSYTPKDRPGHVPPVAALNGQRVDLGGGGPAVHRVGDKGTAGTVSVSVDSTSLVFENANGDSVTIPFAYAGGAIVVGPSVPPGPFTIVTKATEGSSIVKAGP